MPTANPRFQRNGWSVYGLAGLLVAGAVHASTFMATSLAPDNPLFWIMHIGVFPAFLAVILRLRGWSEKRVSTFGMSTTQLRWREVLAYLPPWAIALGGLLFAYVMVNFLLSSGMIDAWTNGGSPPRQLSERMTVRAFSGHWMAFYAFPMLCFGFLPVAPPAGAAAGGVTP